LTKFSVDRYFIVDVRLSILNITAIEKFDTEKMYEIYDEWPSIARKSFDSQQKTFDYENIEHIVIAGMGGSGAIGDILSAILSKTKIHVNVIKGYILPTTVDVNTLVITISVSGNTVETLSALKSAHKKRSKIIAFSSGGKISEYCK
jgi:glucose/mannose-6-phosphate isomerase